MLCIYLYGKQEKQTNVERRNFGIIVISLVIYLMASGLRITSRELMLKTVAEGSVKRKKGKSFLVTFEMYSVIYVATFGGK